MDTMVNFFSSSPFLLYVLLVCSINPCTSLYQKNGPVVRLTPDNFEALVMHSNVVSVVEFYSPKCAHCQALAKGYQRVAENLEGIVLVGAVDCDDRRSQMLCAEYEVKGFPTIKVFPVEQRKNSENEGTIKTPEDYAGPRNAKGISEFATSRVPGHFVRRLEDYKEFKDFVNDSSRIRVVLFSDKETSTLLYQSLSARYKPGIIFGQVHSSLEEAVSELEIEEFPKLLIFTEEKNRKVYEDVLKAPALVAYFDDLLKSMIDVTVGTSESWMKLGTLEPSELEHITLTEDMWLVAFMGASGTEEADDASLCKDEVLALTSAVKNVEQMVNVAVVRASLDDANAIKKYGVTTKKLMDEPCKLQVIRFPFGEHKDEIDEYEMFSGELEAKSLQEFVIDAMPSLASEVDAQSVDLFIGGVTTPGANPLMPKILLFTAKPDCPQIYKALAFQFRKWGLAFAFMPEPSSTTMERFGIKNLPLMVGIQLDPKATGENVDPNSPQVPVRIQAYPGPPKFKQMAVWVTMFGSMLGAQPSEGEEKGSSSFEPLSMKEIADDDALQSQCAKVGICVIGLLDSKGASFSADLDMLQELAIKRGTDPLGFFWIDSMNRKLLLEGFSVLKSDVPTIVALSEHKMRFGVLRESLTQANADNFLNGIMNGRIRTGALHELPSMSKLETSESEESAETAAEIDVEEEMDLSEIMSEEIAGGSESKEDILKRIDEEIEAEMAKKEPEKVPKKKKKSKKAKKQKKDEL